MTAPLESKPTSGASGDGSDGTPVLVLGGGPAGLTAGYQLVKADRAVRVFEAEDQVGGIAMTVERDGYRFDLGGHRFFTKNQEVDDLWHEIMGNEFLKRPRQSRIYWNKKFLEYPLEGTDVIKKLGPIELMRADSPTSRRPSSTRRATSRTSKSGSSTASAGASTASSSRATPRRCGACRAIRSAPTGPRSASRISPSSPPPRPRFFGDKGGKHKSLIKEFNYPRFGPGQMWEMMTDRINEQGGSVELESRVTGLTIEGGRVARVQINGSEEIEAPYVISSLPLRNIVGLAGDGAPPRSSKPHRACATATSSPSPRRRRRRSLPRQLDLHPRAQRRSGPHPELPLLEPLDGARPDEGLRRP